MGTFFRNPITSSLWGIALLAIVVLFPPTLDGAISWWITGPIWATALATATVYDAWTWKNKPEPYMPYTSPTKAR